ncbi:MULTISPECIES: sigma factor-like helix-turn-helix DNA-binding protein [Dethiosulfovibrio]|uniref:UPF0122 protein L2W38_00905 n=2 Tax=Dethiosulfovibrio TaxID=47054 RepID=A0ABS9ENI9_9BACT|nr:MULTISPECIES: sigma factor-like helix-turn-helix DNA-binding protein [Dethiosulfovibrio]MCF4112914.1 DNA-binding protein [Dethiosulfovibrio russensis]MCF4141378.1 DNA-binding protein [Dethiosulfovibrio marinus]MCF4144333.1 DNA-binding protein [Dethiosulfovibrio acidaminovorans]
MGADKLDRRFYIAGLYDLYGPVLTEKQRRIYEMHDLQDLSLSEISDELGISRQGISDQLQRARDRLEELENILGFFERSAAWDRVYADVLSLIDLEKDRLPSDFISEIRAILSEVD